MDVLRVEILNGFTLRWNNRSIDYKNSRSRKMWLLLAYLIFNRTHPVSVSELYRLLWGDEEAKDDPQNALRVLLHRLRNQLDHLGEDTGHTWISRTKEGYLWNPEIPLVLDTDVFEALCAEGDATNDPAQKMALYHQALSLYRTGFLSKLSSEQWVRTLEVRFHDRYLNTVRNQLQLLAESGHHERVIALARDALKLESYSERIWYHLISSLLELDRRQEAIDAYEQVRDIFSSNLGTTPSEELRKLYYTATQVTHGQIIPLESLYNEIRSRDPGHGPILCEYDFFVTVFHSISRIIGRAGITAHLALLTVTAQPDRVLSRQDLERTMQALLEQAQTNLRRDDSITLCSSSQYAILLPATDYESSCAVCQDIIRSFSEKHPRAPVAIQYAVHDIEKEC